MTTKISLFKHYGYLKQKMAINWSIFLVTLSDKLKAVYQSFNLVVYMCTSLKKVVTNPKLRRGVFLNLLLQKRWNKNNFSELVYCSNENLLTGWQWSAPTEKFAYQCVLLLNFSFLALEAKWCLKTSDRSKIFARPGFEPETSHLLSSGISTWGSNTVGEPGKI